MNRFVRTAAVSVLAVSLLVVSAGMASAYQVVRYYGLYLKNSSGTILSEIDYTTNVNNLGEKVDNDSSGDRMRIQAPWRDRAPGNGRGVYTHVTWAKNGTYCYVSGIGEGAQASCGSGWNGYGTTRSQDIQDSNWWFSRHNKSYDLYSDSVRGQLQTCENVAYQVDPCSGSRFMGISY